MEGVRELLSTLAGHPLDLDCLERRNCRLLGRRIVARGAAPSDLREAATDPELGRPLGDGCGWDGCRRTDSS